MSILCLGINLDKLEWMLRNHKCGTDFGLNAMIDSMCD